MFFVINITKFRIIKMIISFIIDTNKFIIIKIFFKIYIAI